MAAKKTMMMMSRLLLLLTCHRLSTVAAAASSSSGCGLAAFHPQPAQALSVLPSRGVSNSSSRCRRHLSSSSEVGVATSIQSSSGRTDNDGENPLGLTPELLKVTNAFEAIGDDKLRYKQLLYMANQLPPMDASSQIPENKVPGCLSTVYVDGKAVARDDGHYVIEFVGDSDGLLTKGLVALLVRGLSGNTAEDIQKVDPKFIEKAGIAASLTPGRNNGFLNMLSSLKQKAAQLEQRAMEGGTSPEESSDDRASDEQGEAVSDTGRPMYDAILNTLQKLNPAFIELKDNSYQHAGHSGVKMQPGIADDATETHFELDIVADAFDGLNLVKRHQLVYMLLGEIMPQIHALQIRAVTPEEAEARKG